jgi:type III restriction enzyme
MPTGILKFCLEYAESPGGQIGGVFESIRQNFSDLNGGGLLPLLGDVYDFRNTFVAHQEKELKDVGETRKALKKWIDLIVWLEGLLAARPSKH